MDDEGSLTGDLEWAYAWDREKRLIKMTTIGAPLRNFVYHDAL